MRISFCPSSRARGFSLIELLIVMAIIAILTAIAYPSYLRYVQKSRRTDAKNALLDLAAREERYFSMNNIYTTSAVNLGYGANSTFAMNVQSSNVAYYQLNVTTTTPTDASGYTATATPIPGSAQATDPCGTYSVNQLGAQTNSTQASGCW